MVFSLRKKLYISFMIIIVLFIVTATFSFLLSRKTVHLMNDILLSEKRLEVVQRLNLFARTANDNGAHYLLAPLYIEDDFKSRFDTSVDYVNEGIAELSDLTPRPEDQRLILHFKDKWTAYVRDSEEILSLKKEGHVTQAQEDYTKDSFDPIAFSLHSFYISEQTQINSYKQRIEDSSRTIRVVNVASASFAILLSIFIAVILSNYLLRRIRLLKTSAQTVAKGDLQVPDLRFSGADELTELANAFNAMTYSLRTMLDSNHVLKQLSSRDGLTGIANRRCYDETLEREWNRLAIASKPLSLILFDIDYFKPFNDWYGHQAGDKCLQQVANLLQEHASEPHQLASRYGGEEFAILLSDQSIEQAMQIAESIQQALVKLSIPHSQSEVSDYVTVSVGISTVTATDKVPSSNLMHQADQALYLAKRNGRNQVAVYRPSDKSFSE
ncbi:diguanylate cyclase [Paenibacillus curdlanolyticus YK9]|uniref:Diguanylate cyclase n=1 Tax=Paenibacillus curdlanolyticus YK9 TaxID=717606 RepID=E0IDA3_9BACL|nr:diguanylate cyclase [Paenibacillus curdlanolyticus]EFM09558.1 diguanylate cyclase [Paenibacillus curdlanolyticus YK9]